METPNLGLSIKEMVLLLLDGKKITLKFETIKELDRFMGNLNTEKSRSKKAHEDFGMDFNNKIIKTDPQIILYEDDGRLKYKKITFYCTDPIPPKKYAVFSISD